MANVTLVDDHILMRKGLANLIKDIGHNVLFEADNGEDLLEKLKHMQCPDVVILDINMPKMDGYQTAAVLRDSFPDIKVLALSMYDDEIAIIRMLRNGARGYILKDCEPSEVRAAIDSLMTKDFYYSELVTGPLIRRMRDEGGNASSNKKHKLSEKEIEFLKYCCTEMTYKEIADRMNVSARTVDGYREELFRKLDVKSRVGLVLYAIKNGIVKV